MSTLIDPFEVVRCASPPARTQARTQATYRPRLATLLEPFELRVTDAVDDDGEWETREVQTCMVVVEESPRGVRGESWRRARCWGADEPAHRGRR